MPSIFFRPLRLQRTCQFDAPAMFHLEKDSNSLPMHPSVWLGRESETQHTRRTVTRHASREQDPGLVVPSAVVLVQRVRVKMEAVLHHITIGFIPCQQGGVEIGCTKMTKTCQNHALRRSGIKHSCLHTVI